VYVLVCYDVVDDGKRTRLLKALKGFLDRVQKSVFEGELDGGRAQAMRQKILEIIDPQEDTVRIYVLCGRCRPRTELLGTGQLPDTEPDWVI
jgi:CRISPR-associated protein Cas2